MGQDKRITRKTASSWAEHVGADLWDFFLHYDYPRNGTGGLLERDVLEWLGFDSEAQLYGEDDDYYEDPDVMYRL